MHATLHDRAWVLCERKRQGPFINDRSGSRPEGPGNAPLGADPRLATPPRPCKLSQISDCFVKACMTELNLRHVGLVVSAGLRRTQFRRFKTDPPERVFGS